MITKWNDISYLAHHNARRSGMLRCMVKSSFVWIIGKSGDLLLKHRRPEPTMSGDANYVKQITTLVDSKNVHEIEASFTTKDKNSVSAGSGTGIEIYGADGKAMKGEGVGTYTEYNFSSDKLSSGLEKNSSTTIAHEVQHQYDYDQGKMKDAYDKNGKIIKGDKSPAEQRAIKNEDFFRKQDKLDLRKKY